MFVSASSHLQEYFNIRGVLSDIKNLHNKIRPCVGDYQSSRGFVPHGEAVLQVLDQAAT
jgi:hypothetical protein